MKLNNFFGIPCKNASNEKNLKKKTTTTGFSAVDSTCFTINRDLAKSYIYIYLGMEG